MPKSTYEIFNDKVSLIYEYDKRSPLFIRMANTEIENNNVEKAMAILQAGLTLYPEYAAAYFLMGKAHILLGNYTPALKNLKQGSELIHSKKTYDYYFKELENIKRQRSLFNNSSKNVFLFEIEENNNDAVAEEKPVKTSVAGEEKKATPVEERLDDLARKIASAKIPEASGEVEENENILLDKATGSSLIISETLAKIYTTQGEYKEAIEVYKKLMIKFPDKAEQYSEKINELQSKIDF